MAMTKTMLALHRWLGLAAGVLILIAAGTAIGMNHADWFRGAQEGADGAEGPFAVPILAAAREGHRLLVGTTRGLFESSDGGTRWQAIALPEPGARVGTLLVDPRRADVLYATAGNTAVLRSSDGGYHWQSLALPFGQGGDAPRVETLALGVDGGLSVVTDAGVYAQLSGGWHLSARPSVAGVERGKRLQRWIEDLHMGDVYGKYGIPVTDAAAIALIVLVLSGYFLFIGREIKIRLARRRVRITLAQKAAQRNAIAA